MKMYLGSLATAVVVCVLFAVPSAYARGGGGGGGMGGGHGGGGFGGGGHEGGGFGGWHGGGHEFHGGGWGWHHHGYGYGGFFWAGPFWWGYPYWWWPPYYDYYGYYGYPPPYYDYPAYDYYGYAGTPAYQYGGNPPSAYPEYDGRDYLQLGHDSGKALRLKTVSQEWLVEYIRAYIINAPLSVRDDFRRGFISGYGEGGGTVLKKAAEEARHPTPPHTVAPPKSESGDATKQP
jgi:hypothetical protein